MTNADVNIIGVKSITLLGLKHGHPRSVKG